MADHFLSLWRPHFRSPNGEAPKAIPVGENNRKVYLHTAITGQNGFRGEREGPLPWHIEIPAKRTEPPTGTPLICSETQEE